jgi:hypothetical protein
MRVVAGLAHNLIVSTEIVKDQGQKMMEFRPLAELVVTLGEKVYDLDVFGTGLAPVPHYETIRLFIAPDGLRKLIERLEGVEREFEGIMKHLDRHPDALPEDPREDAAEGKPASYSDYAKEIEAAMVARDPKLPEGSEPVAGAYPKDRYDVFFARPGEPSQSVTVLAHSVAHAEHVVREAFPDAKVLGARRVGCDDHK